MSANYQTDRTGYVEHGSWRGVSCSAEGCDRPVSCKGLCPSHYNKAKWASGHRSPSVNTEARREARMRHRYGINAVEYASRLAAQGGVCAICLRPPGKNVRAHWGGKLCVDHDHETGKVRGLLCNDCNLAVGYAKSEEVLLRAAKYLANKGGNNV